MCRNQIGPRTLEDGWRNSSTFEGQWAATGESAHCERHPQHQGCNSQGNDQIAGEEWNGEDFSFEDSLSLLCSVWFCVVENWKGEERAGDWQAWAMAYGPWPTAHWS